MKVKNNNMRNISKNDLEKLDSNFEKKVWIDKKYNYDPLYRYKKFYIILKEGKLIRCGVYKIQGTSVVNNANFRLFSQNKRKFRIKNVVFHHGTNFINTFDPLFFYYDKNKKQYIHLKYKQIYDENDIQDLYSYSYNDRKKTLYIRKNKSIIKKIKHVCYYEFNYKKPTWLIFTKKSSANNLYDYYEYNFSLNNEILIGISKEDRFYDERHSIYKYLKSVKKANVLYDKMNVFFYISESESVGYKILYNYVKEIGKIEIIENEFSDDTTVNYKISCNINQKEELEFIYWIIKTKDVKDISIYNYTIKDILKTLDYNIDITKKYNEETLDDYYDKQKIIKKLKEKYNISSDKNLVEKLANIYGKELLLPFEGIDQDSQKYHDIFWEKANNKKYENLYSQLVNEGIIINRWRSERELYKLIKSYFNDAVYQYHADFLGNQSFDIFIPSLKIAFEYQGIQHYEIVEYFGGEEKFKEQQERDKKKKMICYQQNIKLIEWSYYDSINKYVLEKKLAEIDVEI